MRIAILFAFFLCVVFPSAHGLRCYVCEDCEDVTDEYLQSCPLEITTERPENPPTDAPEISTDAPEIPTDAPEVPTDAPEIPTDAPEISTIAPEIPTGAPIIPTDAPEIPTDAPEISTVAPEIPTDAPEISTLAPEIPTDAPEIPTDAPEIPTDVPEIPTDAPEIPTDAPEIPTNAPEIPTVAPEIPTDAPEIPTDAPEIPTIAPEIPTDAPEIPTNAPEVPTVAPEIPTTAPEIPTGVKVSEPGNIRQKRYITRSRPLNNKGCYCKDEDNCDCSNRLSQRADEKSDVDFVCFKAYINIENTSSARVVRGCSPSQLEGKPICELAASVFPNMITGCTTCNTDGCNAALTIRESVFLIVVSMTALWYY